MTRTAFLVYDLTTGRILRTGICDKAKLERQAQGALERAIVAPRGVSQRTQRVDVLTGLLVSFTPDPPVLPAPDARRAELKAAFKTMTPGAVWEALIDAGFLDGVDAHLIESAKESSKNG